MIRKAKREDVHSVAALAVLLWPSHTVEEMEAEFDAFLSDASCAVFLAFDENRPVGFAQCGMRHDYVEGTESSPVGYLEGIFVKAEHRNRGLAGAMLLQCEKWARENGCAEFASDCELTNNESLLFHRRVGFEEANRIICFVKKL